MSALPCFKCGKALRNVFAECDNQPGDGTEFRTYGHYGSTFWDSFDGEELILNICDDCLRSAPKHALAQQKRYLPIHCNGMTGFGRQWVERPMRPLGPADRTCLEVKVCDLGLPQEDVEWAHDIKEQRRHLKKQLQAEAKFQAGKREA